MHMGVSTQIGQMNTGSFHLVELTNGNFVFQWDQVDGGGWAFRHRVYSEWMQYLACERDSADVPPMRIITPEFRELYTHGDEILREHTTEITINDFIAVNGERVVVGGQCQTAFSVGIAVFSRTRNPLTPDDYTGYNVQGEYVTGTSAGQGMINNGSFLHSDMISLNAAMKGNKAEENKVRFFNGVSPKIP